MDEWVVGFDGNRIARNLHSCVLRARAVLSGESLRAKLATGVRREDDMGRSAVDGHRPVVAGDVPVKLVVIVEPAHSISHRVMDLDRPGRVHRIGNVDRQVAIAVLRFRLILEMVAGAIGHTGDIKEQGVIGAVRTGILDGDVAIDAMVRADEDHVEVLGNVDDPILRDRDLGIEAGDVPVARGSGGNESKREKYRESDREPEFLSPRWRL